MPTIVPSGVRAHTHWDPVSDRLHCACELRQRDAHFVAKVKGKDRANKNSWNGLEACEAAQDAVFAPNTGGSPASSASVSGKSVKWAHSQISHSDDTLGACRRT